ncbi:MAG: Dabb family protein [Maritimibacter sp.]|jgi:hypothetical protein
MILHAVYCAIRPEVSQAGIAVVFSKLEALVDQCEGLHSFEAGPNIDLEKKSQGFTHGFVMRFSSRAALEAYATHPAHLLAAGALVDICAGGAEGIMVFDLDLPPAP